MSNRAPPRRCTGRLGGKAYASYSERLRAEDCGPHVHMMVVRQNCNSSTSFNSVRSPQSYPGN